MKSNTKAASEILDRVIDRYQSLRFEFGCDDYYPQMLDTYRRTIGNILSLKEEMTAVFQKSQ
jgi:hypothetical protein